MSNKDLILIAEVTSTHGLNGHFKVRSFSKDGIDGLKSYKTFFTEDRHEFKFNSIKAIPSTKNDMAIGSFLGITSINTIQSLIGSYLYIDRSLVMIDINDEFFYSDIENCNVYIASNSSHYGIVKGVKNIAGSDILVIETSNKKIEMILCNSTFVDKIDIDNKKIYIHVPEFLSK